MALQLLLKASVLSACIFCVPDSASTIRSGKVIFMHDPLNHRPTGPRTIGGVAAGMRLRLLLELQSGVGGLQILRPHAEGGNRILRRAATGDWSSRTCPLRHLENPWEGVFTVRRYEKDEPAEARLYYFCRDDKSPGAYYTPLTPGMERQLPADGGGEGIIVDRNNWRLYTHHNFNLVQLRYGAFKAGLRPA